jgi:hypothetical protein
VDAAAVVVQGRRKLGVIAHTARLNLLGTF